MNDLNTSLPLQFDITKDFELRETIEKNKLSHPDSKFETYTMDLEHLPSSNQYEYNHIEQIDNVVRTLPLINDNIRTNIKLGIEIYKQLNNFDRNYIHTVINEKSTKSN